MEPRKLSGEIWTVILSNANDQSHDASPVLQQLTSPCRGCSFQGRKTHLTQPELTNTPFLWDALSSRGVFIAVAMNAFVLPKHAQLPLWEMKTEASDARQSKAREWMICKSAGNILAGGHVLTCQGWQLWGPQAAARQGSMNRTHCCGGAAQGQSGGAGGSLQPQHSGGMRGNGHTYRSCFTGFLAKMTAAP